MPWAEPEQPVVIGALSSQIEGLAYSVTHTGLWQAYVPTTQVTNYSLQGLRVHTTPEK
jgi:hypothetical protein